MAQKNRALASSGTKNSQVGEPSSFWEAAQHQVWVDAMVEEYSSIITNDVWEVVPRPQDRSVVASRWIYKIKYAANGNVEILKAKFVVCSKGRDRL